MAGQMQRVELDEDDALPPAVPPGRCRVRRRVAVLGSAALVVALAAVGTQTVVDRRRHAADVALAARYVDVPGVAQPFGPDLAAAWSTEAEVAAVLLSGVVVGDVVVGLRRLGRGVEAVAVDIHDGTQRWATPLDLGDVDPVERPYWYDAIVADPRDVGTVLAEAASIVGTMWCTPADSPEPAVLCGVGRGPAHWPALGTTSWFLGVDGTLHRTTFGPAGTSTVPYGDGLLHVWGQTAAGERAWTEPPVRWHVTSVGSATGLTQWEWRSPELGPPDDPDAPAVAWLQASGTRLVMRSPAATWTVATDGEVTAQPLARSGAASLGPGGFDGPGVPPYRYLAGDDGLVRHEVDAALVADDGSLPGLALAHVLGGGLVARGADDAVRWEASDAREALLVLDRTVLVTTLFGLALLDGTDGTTVWTTELGRRVSPMVVTDGRTVLAWDARDTVFAVSLVTGRVVWERSLTELGAPAGTVEMTVPAGLRRIVLTGRERVAILG